MASSSPADATTRMLLSVTTVCAFVVVVIVNYVATSETIGAVGYTNSQVADTHPVYGLPNGWAFAIWGLIFLFLGLYSLYQAVPSKYLGGLECEHVAKIRVPALGMMGLNSAWNFLFGWEFYWVALLDIVLYDALLWLIVRRLAINYFVPLSQMSRGQSIRTKLLLMAPFSLHVGWVTVATALNVQVNLLEEGWMPSADFSIFACWSAVALGLYMTTFRHADLPHTLVTLWALGGIISNQSAESTWGCESRICGACLEASPPICVRANTAPADRLPNAWGALDCAAWLGRTNLSGWGTAETQARNAIACGATIVPKSDAVVYWSVGGMAVVAAVFVAGLLRALLCAPHDTLPAKRAEATHEDATVGLAPETKDAMSQL